MKRLAALLLCAVFSVHAEPVVYHFDPERCFVHWEVVHFGTSTVRGRYGPIAGDVTLDRAAGSGALSLRLATTSVDTGLRPFDSRLREADLLSSHAYPEAYFVASRFRYDGERLVEVRGEFTLRGTSQPLSLHAIRFGCRDAAGTEVCGGDFEATFDRSAFGMTFGLPWIGDRVRLLIQVEGRRRSR